MTTPPRTASFLLIKNILEDVNNSISVNDKLLSLGQAHNEVSGLARALLTAQVEALHQQTMINREALIKKFQSGERIRQFMTQPQQFSNFLMCHKPTIYAVIGACQLNGENRRIKLMTALENLTRDYLRDAGRLPVGVWGEDYFHCQGIQFTNDHIGVWIDNDQIKTLSGEQYHEWSAGQNGEARGGNFGAIFLDAGDCASASAEPSLGTAEERNYASGFEDLELSARQAAVYIQKLFYQMGNLELEIAEAQGDKSNVAGDAYVADKSALDRNYRGSAAIGDRHDELGIEQDNQRAKIVNPVIGLKMLSQVFEDRTDSKILGDVTLNEWIQSADFELTMDELKHPEYRAWNLNLMYVKAALMNTGVLERPADDFYRRYQS